MDININLVVSDINNALSISDVHFVIAANIFSNNSYHILTTLVNIVKPDGFILLEESATLFDLNFVLKTDLILVGKQTTSLGKIYLLLKKRGTKKEQIIVHVTEKNFLWLDEVKSALKKSDSLGHEVVLVCQGEESFGNAIRNCLNNFSNYEYKTIVARLTLFHLQVWWD